MVSVGLNASRTNLNPEGTATPHPGRAPRREPQEIVRSQMRSVMSNIPSALTLPCSPGSQRGHLEDFGGLRRSILKRLKSFSAEK
jgi:hypothetical protein